MNNTGTKTNFSILGNGYELIVKVSLHDLSLSLYIYYIILFSSVSSIYTLSYCSLQVELEAVKDAYEYEIELVLKDARDRITSLETKIQVRFWINGLVAR